jgi:hypothetical protein
MNDFLAELYGTRETIGADSGSDDVEKLAEAQILDQVFESEGIDVNGLDDGTILKVAHELFGDESALVKMAEEESDEEEGDEEEGEEDAEDKVAQADFLGRVMAHSFTQERDNIEKAAGAKEVGQKVLGALRSAASGEGIRGGLETMGKGKKLTRAGKAATEMGKKSPKRSKQFGELAGKRISEGASTSSKGKKELAKGIAATGGLYGGLAAGAGGAGYLAGRSGKKKSAAIDALAEQRAIEWLEENGVGNEQSKLANAVDERAYEMLVEAGYIE